MTVPFRRHLLAPSSALVAVASALLSAACSAPPGAGVGDGEVPEFGAFAPPAAAGAGPAAVNAMGSAAAPPAAPSNAGGSTGAASNEQAGNNAGIGLEPAAAADQGAGAAAPSAPPSDGSMPPAAAPPPAEAPPQQQPPQQQPPAAPPPAEAPPQQPPPAAPPPAAPPPAAAPAPSGDCAGAFFCDGFENDPNGASPAAAGWSLIESFSPTEQSELVLVSSDNARSGNQALRVTGSGGRTGVIASVPQSTYFVRAFFQLDAVPLGPVFIGAGNDQNDEIRFRIQGQSFATINVNTNSGEVVRPANANGGGCPDCVTLTPNQWLCAEMFVDNGAQTATLWIDGVEAAVAGPDVFTAQPAAPNVFFGSWGLQGGVTSVWIDDVAVGPERFGCD